jgi:hypothetical protein
MRRVGLFGCFPWICGVFLDLLKKRYPNECGNDVHGYFISRLLGTSKERKHVISRLVHHFVRNIDIETLENFDEPHSISTRQRACFAVALGKVRSF